MFFISSHRRLFGFLTWTSLGLLLAPCACSGSNSSTGSVTSGGSISAGGSSTGGAIATTAGASALGGTTSSGGNSTTAGSSATGGALSLGGNSATGVANSTGGSTTAGGTSATGGVSSTGGKSTNGGTKTTGGTAATGGTKSTGGTQSTGGASTTGGTKSMGSGTVSTGGTTTGGATASGGTKATGGTAATGGASSTTSDVCPGATQTITVASNGSGQYTTVQAAINSISSGNSKLVEVYVKAGTYQEQVTISKPYVCLVGESATSTIITNTAGTNIVSGGTVLLTGNDFSAANITFQNSASNGSGQAVALMAKGSRQQFLNCRFVSYQDTLYTNTGTQYFRDCYIQGDTDYIFGDATAVFENCTMNNVAEGTAVTAPRTPQGTTYGLVFLGGSLTANPTTSTVRSNHVYLGRPWGPYGAVAFLNVAMGSHINADGWTTMSGNDLSQVRFYEYKSTGAGANPTNATRASRQLSDTQAANYTVKNVLNPWVPGYSQ
jgi:pectinesterase